MKIYELIPGIGRPAFYLNKETAIREINIWAEVNGNRTVVAEAENFMDEDNIFQTFLCVDADGYIIDQVPGTMTMFDHAFILKTIEVRED